MLLRELGVICGYVCLLLPVGGALGADPAGGEPGKRQQQPGFRIWTDITGKYKVEAEFVDFKEGMVRLKKQDGSLLTVAIETLGNADQRYVKSQRQTTARQEAKGPTEQNATMPEGAEPDKADAKKVVVSAVARVRKQLSERLDDKSQILVRVTQTVVSSSVSKDSKERLAAFLVLVQYGGKNVDLYIARTKSVSRQSLDAWRQALSNKSGESIGSELMFLCLPHVEGLFRKGAFQQPTSEAYLRRITGIPDAALETWVEALKRFDKGDHFPVSNTLLLMVQTEMLFQGTTFQENSGKPVLERLGVLSPASLKEMGKRMECPNLKVLAVLLATEEDLFDGQILRKEAATQLSRKLPRTAGATKPTRRP